MRDDVEACNGYRRERGRPRPLARHGASNPAGTRYSLESLLRLALVADEDVRAPSMNNRIVIVGFMGCGKTTVARALAARLSCKMIDLDSFITEREGRSPAKIIQKDGAPAFREIETRALRDVLTQVDARVIALGGGAWTIEANRTLADEEECASVWLDTPFAVCWERIQSSAGTRPLAPDRETARKLYESRQDDYGLSSIHIQVTDSDTPETVADRILTET